MKMGALHPKFSENLNIKLAIEVGGVCPICDLQLIYKKSKSHQKTFEVAHIYPLNPTLDEFLTLKNVTKMSDDPNDPLNLIPLCKNCHKKFDHPRTEDDYKQMRELKLKLVNMYAEKASWNEFNLRFEIKKIVKLLIEDQADIPAIGLQYDAKTLDYKLQEEVPAVVKRDIRRNIQDYFAITQHLLFELEKETSGITDLIFAQVKTYYASQKMRALPKPVIIENITRWFIIKTKSEYELPCRILTAFFIQNCEVF